jgi:hypothetical protein
MGAGWEVIESSTAGSQTHRLVRLLSTDGPIPQDCEARLVGVEELTLAYLRETAAPTTLSLAGSDR